MSLFEGEKELARGQPCLLEEDSAGDRAEEGPAEDKPDEVISGEAGRADPADRYEGEARVDGDEQRRGDAALRQRPQALAQQPRIRSHALVRVVNSCGAGMIPADPIEETVGEVAARATARDGLCTAPASVSPRRLENPKHT